MAVDPPTAPNQPPPSGRTDSGEHAAADKASVTVHGTTFSWRWSGVARGAVIVMAGLPALILAIRAPSKGDVDAAAKTKATEVRQELVAPVNKSTKEQADLQAQLARMAAAIQTLETARQAALPQVPAPGQPKARRRRPDPEAAKQVAAAGAVLKAIEAHAKAQPKPKTLPLEPPKDQQAQQMATIGPPAPAVNTGSAGGANL